VVAASVRYLHGILQNAASKKEKKKKGAPPFFGGVSKKLPSAPVLTGLGSTVVRATSQPYWPPEGAFIGKNACGPRAGETP